MSTSDNNLLSDSRFKKFENAIDKNLSSFESIAEWADIIAFLSRLQKILASFPTFPILPRKALVCKRLSQCLNPNLPAGVHQKTLETYAIIFQKIKALGIAEDLPLYFNGILPFFEHASSSCRVEVLEIFRKYIIPLGSGLMNSSYAIILALLPGLDDETSEYSFKSIKTLETISACISPNVFYRTLWRVIISSKAHRVSAVSFIVKMYPKRVPLEGHILVEDPALTVSALSSLLEDGNTLVIRCALDLLLLHFPKDLSVFDEENQISVATSVLFVLLKRDMSLTRRAYQWFYCVSGGTAEFQATDTNFKTIALACKRLLNQRGGSKASNLARLLRILVFLNNRTEIIDSVLGQIFTELLVRIWIAINDDPEKNKVLSAARQFFDSVNLTLIWKLLNRALLESSPENIVSICESIGCIIGTFSVCEDEALNSFVPSFLSTISDVLGSTSKEGVLSISLLLKSLLYHIHVDLHVSFQHNSGLELDKGPSELNNALLNSITAAINSMLMAACMLISGADQLYNRAIIVSSDALDLFLQVDAIEGRSVLYSVLSIIAAINDQFVYLRIDLKVGISIMKLYAYIIGHSSKEFRHMQDVFFENFLQRCWVSMRDGCMSSEEMICLLSKSPAFQVGAIDCFFSRESRSDDGLMRILQLILSLKNPLFMVFYPTTLLLVVVRLSQLDPRHRDFIKSQIQRQPLNFMILIDLVLAEIARLIPSSCTDRYEDFTDVSYLMHLLECFRILTEYVGASSITSYMNLVVEDFALRSLEGFVPNVREKSRCEIAIDIFLRLLSTDVEWRSEELGLLIIWEDILNNLTSVVGLWNPTSKSNEGPILDTLCGLILPVHKSFNYATLLLCLEQVFAKLDYDPGSIESIAEVVINVICELLQGSDNIPSIETSLRISQSPKLVFKLDGILACLEPRIASEIRKSTNLDFVADFLKCICNFLVQLFGSDDNTTKSPEQSIMSPQFLTAILNHIVQIQANRHENDISMVQSVSNIFNMNTRLVCRLLISSFDVDYSTRGAFSNNAPLNALWVNILKDPFCISKQWMGELVFVARQLRDGRSDHFIKLSVELVWAAFEISTRVLDGKTDVDAYLDFVVFLLSWAKDIVSSGARHKLVLPIVLKTLKNIMIDDGIREILPEKFRRDTSDVYSRGLDQIISQLSKIQDLGISYNGSQFPEEPEYMVSQISDVSIQRMAMFTLSSSLVDIKKCVEEERLQGLVIQSVQGLVIPNLKPSFKTALSGHFAMHFLPNACQEHLIRFWKKEFWDLFVEFNIFTLPKFAFLAILKSIRILLDGDLDRISDIAGRLGGSSNSNLFLSREVELGNKAITLRRLSLICYTSDHDQLKIYSGFILEKLMELMKSGSGLILAEVLFMLRILLLRLGDDLPSSIWPLLSNEISAIISSLFVNADNPTVNVSTMHCLRLIELVFTAGHTTPLLYLMIIMEGFGSRFDDFAREEVLILEGKDSALNFNSPTSVKQDDALLFLNKAFKQLLYPVQQNNPLDSKPFESQIEIDFIAI